MERESTGEVMPQSVRGPDFFRHGVLILFALPMIFQESTAVIFDWLIFPQSSGVGWSVNKTFRIVEYDFLQAKCHS